MVSNFDIDSLTFNDWNGLLDILRKFNSEIIELNEKLDNKSNNSGFTEGPTHLSNE